MERTSINQRRQEWFVEPLKNVEIFTEQRRPLARPLHCWPFPNSPQDPLYGSLMKTMSIPDFFSLKGQQTIGILPLCRGFEVI
ncbi:MAG: hypothetical protein ACE5I5_09055 [Candidatus Heimdallarchaeota archaeon]